MPPLRCFEVEVAAQMLVWAFDPPLGFLIVLPFSNLDLILSSFNISLIMANPSLAAGFPALAVVVRASFPMFLSRFFPFVGRVVADGDIGIPKV
ncbi:hypothetical protein GUJ93_ZPchr0006g43645 [Zizania palustris]|uniref:Uncharacterized protein n=1 Tax=Zizania palustris TaxID=103762 RepID=A0A8J5T6T0_ZIZPA|nr:hypothetical protein GUJ93_ZPchr0006g43645 [Zizania palustris]